MERISAYNGISNEELYELIRGLYPFMEERHRYFWQELVEYDWNLRKNGEGYKNLLLSLTHASRSVCYLAEDVPYLMSEDYYEEARKKLLSANITFKPSNASQLDQTFKGPYDFIYLSNVLDFLQDGFGQNWDYSRLVEYEEKLKKIARRDTTIVLKYAFNYYLTQRLFKNSHPDIEQSFQGEEVYSFPTPRSCDDAIVLLRHW